MLGLVQGLKQFCILRCLVIAMASMLLATVSGAEGQTIDLPVATHGFEQWAGVVANAMSFGGGNHDQSLQALKTFQSKVAAKMQEQVSHTADCGSFLVSLLHIII